MWWLMIACGPPAPPPSIVLVTLDTTRADRMGAYGYKKGKTSNFDSFASEGVRFDAAYTTVPLTSAAHASILTGLYPGHTGVHANGDGALPEEVATIAEHLQGHGYATFGTVGAFVTTSLWNFDQGFDTFFDRLSLLENNQWGLQRPASNVILDIEHNREMIPTDKPLFLWVHLYDPHLPWEAPGIWQNRGADGYDGEIGYSDSQLSWLRKWLEKEMGKKVAWVIVGDHGEGLEGDFEEGHGMFLRQETIRVPFVVRPAEPLPSGVVVDEVVSIVDVAPTILALAGLPANGMDGIDLSPAWLDGPSAIKRPPVVVESEVLHQRLGWAPEVAVLDEGLKMYDSPGGPQLYDLAADPGESIDLAGGRAADVERLRATATEVRGYKALGTSHELGGVSAQLEALGYVSGVDRTRGEPSPIDGKTRNTIVRSLEDAREASSGKRLGVSSAAIWRELLAIDPDLIEARLGLVLLAERSGDKEAALALLDEGIVRTPDVIALRLDRGRLLLALDRRPDAAADANAILDRDPSHRSARDLLLSTLGPEAVLTKIREWSAQFPNDPFLHARAGQALLDLNRIEEAEAELQLALQTEIPWVGVHVALARIEFSRGRYAEALEQLNAEVALHPNSLLGWLDLGQLTLSQNDAKTALSAFETALRLAPTHPVARQGFAEAKLRVEGASAVAP